MAFVDELKEYVGSTFRSQWATRDGTVIPVDTDLKLGNDGANLDATCLYADMIGSTNLVDTKSATFSAEVYKAFLHCASRLIRANEGQVTAFDGDRVMGVFIGGSKNSNAAKCALQINWAVKNIINPGLKSQYPSDDYQLDHCVGIDSSKVMVARTGVRGANDLVWIGRAGNYAAKLCAIRNGYPTIITQSVYDSLADWAKFAGGTTKDMWTGCSWPGKSTTVYGSTYWWSL